MNCQTARQTLELLRPTENAKAISSEAEQHVRDCLDCQDAVLAQQQLDLQIGRVCRDVPVPVGLKDRILAEIEATRARESSQGATSAAPAGADGFVVVPLVEAARRSATGDRSRAASQWKWLMRSLAVACVVAGVWIAIRPDAPTLTLYDVTKQAIESVPDPGATAKFTAFRNGAPVKKPGTMITVDLTGSPRQLGNQDVAMYYFTIRNSAGKLVQGRLVVLPKALVIDPPTATAFLAGPIRYNAADCTTAWVEGPYVYVCCVSGGKDLLDKLQQLAV
jgi:hypothetical protein